MHRVSESCSIRRCSIALEAPLELSTEAAGTASAGSEKQLEAITKARLAKIVRGKLESCKKEFRDRGSGDVRTGQAPQGAALKFSCRAWRGRVIGLSCDRTAGHTAIPKSAVARAGTAYAGAQDRGFAQTGFNRTFYYLFAMGEQVGSRW